MTDKKIIDDYYIQHAHEIVKNTKSEEKKKKITIKWKIKVKKEFNLDNTNVEEKENQNDNLVQIKDFEKKDEIKESKTNNFSKEFEKLEIEKKHEIKTLQKSKKSLEKKIDDFKKWSQNEDSIYSDNSVKSKEYKKLETKKEDDKLHLSNQKKEFTSNPNKDFNKKFFVKDRDINKRDKNNKKENFLEDSKWKKLFKKDKKLKYKNNFLIQNEEDDLTFIPSSKINKLKKEQKKIEDIKQDLVSKTGETVIVPEVLSLKELSEKIWVPLPKLIWEFMKNGMMVTLNSKIDFDTACIISDTFWVKLQKDMSSWFWVEDLLSWNLQALLWNEDKENLKKRAPIVSIMGHVDHGKTSLLDYIRKSKVAAREAGWITQSIWAYQVEYKNEKITFLDTPGHEAFTIMRARWAKLTDIAVLVVAADEWVKPQTIESINHAKEAWIPIIVAINKMDKEWANPDNVKTQLRSQWLLAEDWWGDVPMIWVSALKWTWVNELLEMILIVAEMQELKANPNRLWVATVIESHLDAKLWPVCTVLVNAWTINKWDCIVCKWAYWRVKILKDHLYKNINSRSISEPVLIVWLNEVVEWWDIVEVVSDIEKARKKSLEFSEFMLIKSKQSLSSIDMIMSKIKSWNLKQLKIVLKADSDGTLEAIRRALQKLSTKDILVQIIHAWVWNITEGDVLLSESSQALIIWYNVDLLWNSKKMVEDKKLEYISSKVIYHITEKVEKIINWMFDPKEIEVNIWTAEIWGIFYEDKEFSIIWLKLYKDSVIRNNSFVRIIRWNNIIWKWFIENLKSWVVDVTDLKWPTECWVKLKTDTKLELKDKLEIYLLEREKSK